MTTLKAIDTHYNGYKFRSRLEARWAVFYDALGIEYDYEPQGYNLDGLLYLPDFWIPHINSFIEIKPTRPTREEGEKAGRLARATGFDVFVFWGPIPYPYPDNGVSDSAYIHCQLGWDNCQHWCECPGCGRFGIHFDGLFRRIHCGCKVTYQKDTTDDSPRLLKAYAAARSARFSGGEA